MMLYNCPMGPHCADAAFEQASAIYHQRTGAWCCSARTLPRSIGRIGGYAGATSGYRAIGTMREQAFAEAHHRAAADERVEIVCAGGLGRTGTAIACIAQLADVPPQEAVEWTRQHYHPRAIETPWQRSYIHYFSASR